MATLDDMKNYLRVDSDDFNEDIQSLIDSTQIYIDSCVGTAYKESNDMVKLADLLLKKIVSDNYDSKSQYVSTKTTIDNMTTTILDILSNYDGT
ncbi:head-tail connector protein [Clostridium felsineum]|uniref:head-tail connector protein n=1 Tax=Clostridium felsineum TaxID=36839 RepID=UPI00098CCDD4|nr:head-tail connector protein [Clostridium felsineum]URZ15329.1 hypothetical protein CLFE_013470 [Clostridium felsineum DSM 794]